METALIWRIAQEVGLPEAPVAAVLSILQDGGTVPFIARYRKEATGGLEEAKVRKIEERLIYHRELQDRRAVMLNAIAAQGKLTDDLRSRIDNCCEKVELEDFFLSFRPQKKTRATEAIGAGLEPLAEYLWNQEPDAWGLEEHADVFINPAKGVNTQMDALGGAAEIIALWICENSDFRKALREMMWKQGSLVCKVVPAKMGQKTKYSMYYDRREPVATIPSHRVLAIRRGTKEGILTSYIEIDDPKAIEYLISTIIRDRESVFAPVLEVAIRESYTRLIRPVVEAETRALLKEKADNEAIRVFQENLANLLLSPPGGPMVVIGFDPVNTAECKLAMVDAKGNFLEEALISPLPPKNDIEGTRAALKELIAKHGVQALAIGTGTGSREIERTVRRILNEENLENVLLVGVNDAGIAVYATSRIGREDFPDLDSTTRGAITIARRLQDPLAELVKVDPKTIGVGQYQHDVDQKELHRRLIRTVESSVNQVGVDLNTASFSLLRYVAGISDRMSRRIVNHRAANGPFPSRASLMNVPGMDARIFQQAAGFLRIHGGENPLERSAIHPECYPVVERMAASASVALPELIENKTVISNLKLEEFVTDTIGLPTLHDINDELLRPGRDPRKAFTVAKFRADVKDIGDLKEGAVLEGTVTNVTNFGAFVDVGVHQDGLVHLSQMSNRFIRDPREAVKVGDVVQVKVISVDAETKRIGLSIKALLPPPPRRRPKPGLRKARAQETGAPRAVAADKLSTTAAFAATDDGPDTRADGSPADGQPSRPRRRRHRTGRRRTERPLPETQEPATAEKSAAPEPTLQEKIAILQSKFRGIS